MRYGNGTSENDPGWSHQLVMFVFTLPTICVGLVLNGLALGTICCRTKRRTKPVVYMANLILSDFLLLLSLPFKIYAFHVRSQWALTKWFCRILESLCYVNTYASILLITVICVDRYVAVKHSFVSRAISSRKKTVLICSAIWILVGTGSAHFYLNSKSESCFYLISAEVLRMEFVAPLEILFLICMFLMMFCSLQIIRDLKVRASETRANWADKSAKIVLSNLFTFLLCFTPYHVGLLLYSLAVNRVFSVSCEVREYLRDAVHYSLYLANINCCLDAIYYFYGIKELFPSKSPEKLHSSTQIGTVEATADLSLDRPFKPQSGEDIFQPSCSGMLLHNLESDGT
ncbi:G-protein coupled receptor 35-like [Stegostoma tigrinum]|uniref:G-protein coupled receptor 35-like n=1 Tax=Stegostoma tigrinum TaxID=3053191 RepID=UPI0028707840|nr:G-protein coupled receptor 35-like [Stegostoma tigrinum]